MMSAVFPRRIAIAIAPFLFVAAVGIFLRVHSFEPISGDGFDEQMYATYVEQISETGALGYPALIHFYLQGQSAYPISLPPPTRVTFILAASAWHGVFGWPLVSCLRAISCLAAVLVLLISCAFAARVRGPSFALAILVLMAVAPTQIFMAHRALIDGFFTLFALLALWSLWELLQESPHRNYWLGLYSIALALLILTKENAAFVYIAVVGILVANRWLAFGRISRPLLAATIAAPLLGVALLILCAGGLGPLAKVFTVNAAKSIQTPYAISTGDGPWFRYLSDLLLVSPTILILAIGGAFLQQRSDKAGWFFLGFVFFSYLLMCNVPYGMNLRYANMWDFPLRYLALVPVFLWGQFIESEGKRRFFLIGVVALLGISELANYLRIFVANSVYDPIPSSLLKALDILK